MLHLNSCPTKNGLAWGVALLHNGQAQATLNPGDSVPLTVAFDQVRLVNTPRPALNQISPVAPNDNCVANPGSITIIENGPQNTVVVSWSYPGGNAQRVIFS